MSHIFQQQISHTKADKNYTVASPVSAATDVRPGKKNNLVTAMQFSKSSLPLKPRWESGKWPKKNQRKKKKGRSQVEDEQPKAMLAALRGSRHISALWSFKHVDVYVCIMLTILV